MELAPLLHSISRPVKFRQTNRPLQSVLASSASNLTDRPKASDHHHTGTDSSTNKPNSASKPQTDWPLSSDVTDSGSPMLHRSRKDSFSSMSSESGSEASNQPPLDLYVEEGEVSDDQDITVTEQEQHLSEEQSYRETMRGICSFMGWSHIQ